MVVHTINDSSSEGLTISFYLKLSNCGFSILEHVYAQDAPVLTVEGHRTIDFNYYARLDHLTKTVCTPTSFDEYYTDRDDR